MSRRTGGAFPLPVRIAADDATDYVVSADVEPPKPTNWLNYHGDLGPQLGNILGPNVFGEHYAVVAQEYDPDYSWGHPVDECEPGEDLKYHADAAKALLAGKFGRTRLGFCILPIVLKSGWRPPVPA